MKNDDIDTGVDRENVRKEVKLDSSKSMFKKMENENVKPSLNEAAQQHSDGHIESMNKAVQLTKKFVKVLEDKTLIQNKGPVELSFEKELINKLINFAIEMNSEHADKSGIGSIGLITLLFNCLLKLRNHVNESEYTIFELNKTIAELKKSVAELNKKIDSGDK